MVSSGTDTIESSGGRKPKRYSAWLKCSTAPAQPDHAEPGDRLGIVGRLRQDPGQGLLTLLERAGIEILLGQLDRRRRRGGDGREAEMQGQRRAHQPDSHSAEK
jgi:hypothetical protein